MYGAERDPAPHDTEQSLAVRGVIGLGATGEFADDDGEDEHGGRAGSEEEGGKGASSEVGARGTTSRISMAASTPMASGDGYADETRKRPRDDEGTHPPEKGNEVDTTGTGNELKLTCTSTNGDGRSDDSEATERAVSSDMTVCADDSADEGNAVEGRGGAQGVNGCEGTSEGLGELGEMSACGGVVDEPGKRTMSDGIGTKWCVPGQRIAVMCHFGQKRSQ